VLLMGLNIVSASCHGQILAGPFLMPGLMLGYADRPQLLKEPTVGLRVPLFQYH
jgi:hypothetical protein